MRDNWVAYEDEMMADKSERNLLCGKYKVYREPGRLCHELMSETRLWCDYLIQRTSHSTARESLVAHW